MKPFKLLLAGLLVLSLVVSCGPDQSKGYGYNTKTEHPETVPSDTVSRKTDRNGRPQRKQTSHTMNLYDLDGNFRTYISAYKGTFDGHTFYLFKNANGDIQIVMAD